MSPVRPRVRDTVSNSRIPLTSQGHSIVNDESRSTCRQSPLWGVSHAPPPARHVFTLLTLRCRKKLQFVEREL